jgi:transposase
MIKDLSGNKDRLTAWIDAVEADNLVQLRSFTAGLRRDFDAVTVGLTSSSNSGAVEAP